MTLSLTSATDAAARRAALERLLRDRLAHADPAPVAANEAPAWPRLEADPARRLDPFPLTAIQQAYWLGRKAEFELGGVGIHGYFELLCPDLDVARLGAAWRRVIERHDMLRAVIQADGRQRILDTVPPYDIAIVDLTTASPADADAAMAALRGRLSHQVLALDTWPLFEMVAVRLPGGATRLLFSEDAIHVDLVSSALVLEDWIRFYRDPQAVLPTLELSYRDYVLALERLRETPAYRRAAEYWRARVDTMPPGPDLPRLPLDGPPRFERMQFVLAAEGWERIRRRAAAENLTASAILLAVYAEVLGQWSSTLRFALNVTVYNRLPLHPQVSAIAGDFTSMVLLEVDRTQAATLLERGRALQRTLWADLEHHAVSGVEVLRDLAARRGSAGAAMPYVFTSSLGSPGYRALEQLGTIEYAVTQTPQVLIDQQVFEDAGRLVLSWDVVTAAYPPGLAADMFRYGTALLEQLASSDDAWDRVPEAPSAPRPRSVHRAAPARLPHEQFADRAAAHPRDVALVTAQERVTYGDLLARCNRTARLLRMRGAVPGEPVAILAARGWRAVAAALAVGTAGAPYLPLDPAWPRDRRRHVLAHAGVRLVVTDDPATVASDGCEAITFEDAAALSPDPLPTAQAAGDLAYVMYTSGSTGTPKAVLIEQRSVAARMADMVERLALGPADAAFAVTALHHDLSVFDIFGMLAAAGGTLVVPDAAAMQDPSTWLALLDEGDVTVWNSVPAFMDMLLRCAPAATMGQRLRTVLLSGDRVRPDLVRAIGARFPSARVVSLGGPTETTVWDIWHPVTQADLAAERIPYGVPLSDAAYYVMKDNLEECPVWTPGELCISGTGLARGYLGDADLTAARFVRHPATGARLYRSGDVGRRLPNGEIDILGRRDRQVKIHGHRIELDEIERALAGAPGVRAAAVQLTTGAGEPELIACVVADESGGGDVTPLGALALPPDLAGVCARRRTHREFLADPVPLETVAALLGCLADHAAAASRLPRYLYPSAGTQYAVHTFMYVEHQRVPGLAAGWHRYAPDRHALTRVSASALPAAAHHARNRDLFSASSFSIFLVADLEAMSGYGTAARDFALLEAGAMMQLLMMAAGTLRLGLCPIGGLEDGSVAEPLSLGPGRELLHSLCGGAVREAPPARLGVDGSPLHRGTEERLRSFLRQRLPRHMVPHRIVTLDALPLTSNGKIDRAALPVSRPPAAGAPPATAPAPLAGVIVQCWRSVLGRDDVSAHDRIFDAGADSFQTVQAWTEIKRRTGLQFELVEMFRSPTPASLAEQLAGIDAHPEVAAGEHRAALRRARNHLRH